MQDTATAHLHVDCYVVVLVGLPPLHVLLVLVHARNHQAFHVGQLCIVHDRERVQRVGVVLEQRDTHLRGVCRNTDVQCAGITR
jgi:hypothetical protein